MDKLRWRVIFLTFVAGIVFVIYSVSLDNRFYWDDEELITNNYALRTPLNFKNYFHSNPMPQRPVATLSFAIDYSLYGLRPFGYHVTQIVLHILNTFLIYYIASLLFSDKRVWLFSSGIFAFHPIHAEAVNLFLGRSDLLSSLFFLTAFVFYVKYSHTAGDKGRLFFYFSLLAFALSLLSKETAIIFPLVIIIYDMFIKQPVEGRHFKGFVRYIPYFALSIFYFIFWYLILHSPSGGTGKTTLFKFYGSSLYSTLLTQIVVVKKYMGLLFFPLGMSAWYELPVLESILNPEFFFSLTLLVLFLFVCFFKLKRDSIFFVLWIFITILPVSNLIPIPGSMMAERWLYIPSAGFSMFLAVAIGNIIDSAEKKDKSYHKKLIYFITALFLAFYCVISFARNLDFDDELVFFKKLYESSPSSQLVRNNLGLAYLRKNKPDDAIRILEPLAKETESSFPSLILNNLGGAYEKKGDNRKAEICYKAAIQIKPDYIDARINLGSLYLNLGKKKEAFEKFNEVIKNDSYNSSAHYNLGLIYYSEGEIDTAIEEFKKSLKMRPDLADAHSDLGLAYYGKGLLDLAETECKRGIELDPDYYQAYGNLGLVYMEQGKKALALQNFKKLLALNPGNSLAKKYIKDIQAR